MTIREELQELEDEQVNGYRLKTNGEIIDIISEFGNGVTEFHTLDINRLVVENQRANKLVQMFNDDKVRHELPNDNNGEYNQGYVKAMSRAINHLKALW